MVWWAIVLFGLLLFATRTKIGAIIATILFLVGSINLILLAFEPEKYEAFLDRNPQIAIYDYTVTEKTPRDFPWFGEDENTYYIFYPAIYYFYPKSAVESCAGFNKYKKETWCTDNYLKIVTCYNEDPRTCYGTI